MQFRLTRRDLVVIGALSVILSPILIPVGVVYGVGCAASIGISAAANKAAAAKENRRALQQLLERGPSNDQLKAALQKLADDVAANPCFQTLLEFGMGVLLAKDYLSAAAILTRAAEASAVDDHKAGLLNALYYKGFCLQQVARFTDAAEVFSKARAVVVSLHDVHASDAGSVKITEADCLAAQAYSMFCSLDDINKGVEAPFADRVALVEKCLEMINEAIRKKGTADADSDTFAYRAWIGFQRFASRAQEPGFEETGVDVALLQAVLDDIVRAESLSEMAEESIPSELLALKVHTLYLLGRRAEAIDAYHRLKEIDSSVYCADVASLDVQLSWLTVDWPRPRAMMDQNRIAPHELLETRFKRPTWCDVCRQFITLSQNIEKCFECTHCRSRCHRDCKDKLLLQGCWSLLTNSKDVLAHKHIVKKRFTHSLHDCLVCQKSILMFQDVFQCTACQSFFHDKCATLLDNTVIEH
jgi:tetratricopeptide (TPR) repeat protein